MKNPYKTIKVGDKVRCWSLHEASTVKTILEEHGFLCHLDGCNVLVDKERSNENGFE